MNPLKLFFHWPDGGVWSNIVANLLWLIPTSVVGRKAWKKHRRKQNQMHDDIQRIHKHLGVK